MDVLTTAAAMEAFVSRNGLGALVPTMGALHEGHAALVRQGAALARERGYGAGCVVTIFVNPSQFNEQADFARYPRTLEADVDLCAAAGARAVFAPSVEDVYPGGVRPYAGVLPPVATRPLLEDAFRPGHFAGVCQVVSRLFQLTRPAAAIFGEKDWQQLQVIRAMTRVMGLGVEIVPGETVREADGLAMSSRNRFLKAGERDAALALSRALAAAREAETAAEAEAAMARVLEKSGARREYAVVRDADTLEPTPGGTRRGSAALRAIIAARVGDVRLIDNDAWV